jgi:hypothetical protein
LNYIDTQDVWAEVEDTNLETDKVVKASVGALLRWVSRGERIAVPTLLITVNSPSWNQPYFFETYNAKSLADAAEGAQLDGSLVIFKTTNKEETEFAMVEWIVGKRSHEIVGVKITAKSATSDRPFVSVCPIDAQSCSRAGDILEISEGGFQTFSPSSEYVLPQTVRLGPTLLEKPPRSARTDFKQRTSPSLPVLLRPGSEPGLAANPQFANAGYDSFFGAVLVLNKHAASSSNPITFTSATASYRFVGTTAYTPCSSFTLQNSDVELPVTIHPRESFRLEFEARVPRTKEDAALEVRMWNRAFCARHRPVRIKLELEDIDEERCSLVFEYVYTPYPFEKTDEKDVDMFWIDDVRMYERYVVHVAVPRDVVSKNPVVLSIGGKELNTRALEKLAYGALKTGKTEVDLAGLGIRGEENPSLKPWTWKAYALVDLSCRRVYAFKVIMHENLDETKTKRRRAMGCIGYVLCPDYGRNMLHTPNPPSPARSTVTSQAESGLETKPGGEMRPIAYAIEHQFLPVIEPLLLPEVVWDDTVDDIPDHISPASSTGAASNPPANGLTGIGPLETRLASIDTNLARLADAMEKLVVILGSTK